MDNTTHPKGKWLAVYAYATSIFLFVHLLVFIALFGVAVILNNEKKQSFASFHLRQMAGILAVSIAVSIFADLIPIGIFPILLTGFLVLLALLGMISALRNQQDQLPLVGNLFQKWFSFIK